MRGVVIIASVMLSTISGADSSEPQNSWNAHVDWKRLGAAFEQFVEYPSPRNADAVTALLPRSHAAMGTAQSGTVSESIYRNLPMLDRQVQARVPEAARLGFALYAVVDGAAWEDLDILLGKLIRADPDLFLRELARWPEKAEKPYGLFVSAGPPYSDSVSAYCFELRQRVLSLRAVASAPAQPLRDRAVERIEEALSRCPPVPEGK